jgi:ATP-dependent Zn protease
MSIVKQDPKDIQSNGRQRYAWETEETLVERRKRLRYRILRQFTFRRVLLLIILLILFTDPNVARFVKESWTNGTAILGQMFQFDLSQILVRAFQILMFMGLAIGQFALLFWFLGRARMYTIWPGGTTEGVSFADYRGQPELLEQARQIVKLLRGVRVFEESGGQPLNGLLLEGPPGTGKTWLAQAISTEAGVPFFYVDASSMQSMFIGIAPLKVMNLYRKARNAAKDYGASIVFIDEIDALGARPGVSTTGNSMGAHTPFGKSRLPIFFGMGAGMGLLSTLLVEMDGFSAEHGWWARKKRWFYQTILWRKPPKPEKRVLTIGATNRIAALDPALLRPGRFDKKIRVDAPDLEGRRDIIEYYLSKMAHDDTMDSLILAAETQYYTPADIKYLLNEALRYALFDGRTYITYEDFRRAQPEHEMGLRSPIKNLSYEDKYSIAIHEGGHAVALRLFMPNRRISRITIIRQGQAFGHVSHQSATEEFDYISTHEMLMNRMRVAVAGKAAEMEFLGEDQQSFGVGGDFPNVRNALQNMAAAGMFGALGVAKPEAKEVATMMEEVFLAVLTEVRYTLRREREMCLALAELLMEKEELLAKEVEEFFDQYGLYTPKIQLNSNRENAAVTGN